MNPAPSVIVFTVLSGMGFGFLALLGLFGVQGWLGFFFWGTGFGLAVAGLVASTFHLGNPQRALRAFTQWRTSWLSREGWAAVITLGLLAPQALSDWLGLGWGRGFGIAGAVGCGVTVVCTGMIYAQLKTVPRWHHWTTPAVFLAFALAGGLILSGVRGLAVIALCLLGVLMAVQWFGGAGRFARAGVTMESATGLGRIGRVAVFEQPHTGGNYLMREMIFTVGRRHAERVRMIAMVSGGLLPVVALVFVPGVAGIGLAAVTHLLGAFAHRWLFFAEAEHVVGLYYGRR
ncbi:MAG: dibenzothiophene desulfurase [Rhodobacter sp. CACIA14H1]|nr:MAG: dibenzothiophene desulfurase [Rhodobacter sp. CACIA14H1]